MQEFYADLKAKRQEKGITLQEIHERTRLPLHYLQAIEEGEMDRLPAGYQRIYLRRYVREIGLNVEEVMRDYDLFMGEQGQSNPAESTQPLVPRKEIVDDAVLDPPARETVSWWGRWQKTLQEYQLFAYFWLALAAVALGLTGYFTVRQYRAEQQHKIEIKEISLSEMIQTLQAQDSLLTPQATSQKFALMSFEPQVEVRLRARERTWVREIRDRKDTTDYIMPAGMERTIQARERVNLMLGRADGVEIWLNDQPLGMLGEANEVVLRLELTADGVASLVRRKVSPKSAVESDSSRKRIQAETPTTVSVQ